MALSEFVDWDRSDPVLDHRAWEPSGSAVTLTALGPLRLLTEGRDVAPTTPKLRQMLAVLVARAGQVTPTESFQRELWPDGPPSSAQPTMQNYVYQLRSLLRDAGVERPEELLVTTQRLGYALLIDPAQLDFHRFQVMCVRARSLMVERRFGEAAAQLCSAIALWSGPPLADVQHGPILSSFDICLQEQRRNARILRVQAEIEAGRNGELADELIDELRSLISTHPLDEVVHAQLIQVLDRSGRRGDALRTYRTLCANLDQELGLEPTSELQRLHQELISDGIPRH